MNYKNKKKHVPVHESTASTVHEIVLTILRQMPIMQKYISHAWKCLQSKKKNCFGKYSIVQLDLLPRCV